MFKGISVCFVYRLGRRACQNMSQRSAGQGDPRGKGEAKEAILSSVLPP